MKALQDSRTLPLKQEMLFVFQSPSMKGAENKGPRIKRTTKTDLKIPLSGYIWEEE